MQLESTPTPVTSSVLLVITNAQDATADYLVPILEREGVTVLRLNTDSLVSRAQLSYRQGIPALVFDDRRYEPCAISNVWYRRPEQLKSEDSTNSPEEKYALEEWSAAFEGFFAHIPQKKWVNYPPSNTIASHKLEQLTSAHRLGFRVPDTLVTQDETALRYFYEKHEGRVVVKPMATGYIDRPGAVHDSLIYTNVVSEEDLDDLADLSACPTLFQQLIDKCCDVRITVVDADIHAVELIAKEQDGSQRCDIRRFNMSDVTYRSIELPAEVRARTLALMEHYSLRFAAIDMAVAVTGEWFFLEVNPNGQWAWLDLSAGLSIAASFVESFTEQEHR